MRPGDLVRPFTEYSESRRPPCGVIIEIANLSADRYGNRTATRFNVLFPEGIFPMYDFEMEVISEAG
jgi:hypothetical protein